MPTIKKPKIAYLFGAGSTHAEIMNLEESPSANFKDRNGLLISNVSKRVIQTAQENSRFKKNIESVTSREGANIELLISLIESNKILYSDWKVAYLKGLVEDDITKRLSKTRRKKFYLHKGILELHSKIDRHEELLGFISLNYDPILDDAYEIVFGEKPIYCLHSKDEGSVPLLKLHGSFNWKRKKIYGKQREIPIIPLGINKNYLAPPYNFIWGRAFELLVECDILRVIGCSLNQNDLGLIDLLFKAHLEREREIEIQIIDFEEQGRNVKQNYGFFPGIVLPMQIEDTLIADPLISDPVGNPFKIWLKAKGEKMLDTEIKNTRFLKKCL